MTETIINTNTLPEILIKIIPTEKVCVKELNGIIQLMPIKENTDCFLRGFASDSNLTVDKFLSMTHDKTEMN
jgi:hypothetical protein